MLKNIDRLKACTQISDVGVPNYQMLLVGSISRFRVS